MIRRRDRGVDGNLDQPLGAPRRPPVPAAGAAPPVQEPSAVHPEDRAWLRALLRRHG